MALKQIKKKKERNLGSALIGVRHKKDVYTCFYRHTLLGFKPDSWKKQQQQDDVYAPLGRF